MLMQQICEREMCEAMPANEQSTWLMPDTDDEAFLPWLIPDVAERFGAPAEVAGR
ncbi:hypothetical protein Q3C01_25170 [Bradyrhizobium sp. UFLA05-109]